MSFKARFWPVLIFGAIFLVDFWQEESVAHGDIVFMSGTRSVSVFVSSTSSKSSSTAGPFNESVSRNTTFSFGSVSKSADQNSLIPLLPAPDMTGTGNVAATVILNAAVGTIGGTATSSFDTLFQVSQSGTYDLSASVSWTGNLMSNGGPSSNFATFELIDTALNQTLFTAHRNVSLQGTQSLTDVANLVAGRNYRLKTSARISGGVSVTGNFSSNAGWSFGLNKVTSVPEPALPITCWIAACLFAIRPQHKEKRNGRSY